MRTFEMIPWVSRLEKFNLLLDRVASISRDVFKTLQ